MSDDDNVLARIYDSAGQWEPNEHGLWCPNCGDIIATDYFFERDELYEPPRHCCACGFPDFGQ
jgi:hypothetical protein